MSRAVTEAAPPTDAGGAARPSFFPRTTPVNGGPAGDNPMSIAKKYGYFFVTLALFLGSLAGHWTCKWFNYVDEQRAHHQPLEVGQYLVQALDETLENWQSEFMQLIWQVAGLALLLHVGSPQSKEGDERKEEKLDELLKLMDPEKAATIIHRLNQKYPKR
jgi:hypothetical protein